MSKTDQLRAMREARLGRKPNPFEDAARGRDPVSKGGSHVTDPASHSVKRPLKVDLGRKRRSAPATERPGGEMTGPANPVAKATKGKIRTAGQDKDASRKTKVDPPDGVASRLGARRMAQDAATNVGRVAIQAECPVCAARRKARAAAQKKWRKGRQAEKRSEK